MHLLLTEELLSHKLSVCFFSQDTRGEEDGYCCVIELAKDSIANYVVNKAIEVMENDMFEEFVGVISSSRDELVCYVATFFEFVNSQSICLLTY